MHAVVLTRHGPPEALQVQEVEDPVLEPDGVMIEVRAAGVNFTDLLARLGLYPDAPKPPCVLGYEVSGVVERVGPEVKSVLPGDRVLAATRFRGYAERVTTAAANVLPLPANLSFEAGAAVPVNYATAWAALVRYGSVQPGERVLIHSAGGGVGTAAVQIGCRLGAEVYGTASLAKRGFVSGLGATVIDDSGRRGQPRELFDLVLDGRSGRALRRSYARLRPGGRLVTLGASGLVRGDRRSLFSIVGTLASAPHFSSLRLMRESKTVIGFNALALWDTFGTLSPLLRPVLEAIAREEIEPVVDETLPLQRAADAHRRLANRQNLGKVVLAPS